MKLEKYSDFHGKYHACTCWGNRTVPAQVQGVDRSTSQKFSDVQIASQVCPSKPGQLVLSVQASF